MKVLLVDDDEALATLFSTVLEKDGFEVTTANNGTSGIEKVKTEKPDLVLLDQILPDIGGNEVLKTLKADDETKAVPVAILSNFGQNELVKDAINNGAVEYILKYQIEPQDLVAKVKELLKQSTQGAPATGKPSQQTPQAQTPQPVQPPAPAEPQTPPPVQPPQQPPAPPPNMPSEPSPQTPTQPPIQPAAPQNTTGQTS